MDLPRRRRGRPRPSPRRCPGRPTRAAPGGRSAPRAARATRRSAARPRPPARSPGPVPQRNGHGMTRTRKSNAWPARTIAPAEQPASTAPRSWAAAQGRPDGAPLQRARRYPGLPARQVDQVRLADAPGRPPGRRRPRGPGRAPARPPPRGRRNAPRPSTPSGRRRPRRRGMRPSAGSTTRGRATPVDARRPASTSAIAGRNSPAPTSATGPGIPRESICETASMTPRQRWTLVATVIGSGAVFLDGTIVNVALPSIGRDLPSIDLRRPRGPDVRRQRLPGGPRRAADPRRRAVRSLRPAPHLRDRAGQLRDHVGAVRARADARVARRLPAAPGRGRRAAGPRRPVDHHPDLRGRPERGRAFGIWASATSGLVLLGPLVGGLLVDTVGWRVAFLINVPVLGVRAVGDAAATWRSRATRPRGASTGSARLSPPSPSAACPSGSSAAPSRNGRTRPPGSPSPVGVVALVAFPILMATAQDPLVPLSLFRSRAFTTINLATFFVYGAPVRHAQLPGHRAAERARATRPSAAGAVGLPMGICLTLLSTPGRGVAGRIGARRFLVGRPDAHGRRPAVVHAPAGRLEPWLASIADPATPDPAGRHAHRRPAVGPPVRGRHRLRRRAADDHADGLGAGAVLGPRRRRSTTRSRGSASRSSGRVIFVAISATFYARWRARARSSTRQSPAGRARVPAAQPAARDGARRTQVEAATQRLDRGVPPGDARRGRPARGRRRRSRGSGCATSGPAGSSTRPTRRPRRPTARASCRATGTPGPTTGSPTR